MLYLAIMKSFALILSQLMDSSTEATRSKRLVESVRQFRITYELLLFGQLCLRLMQIWHRLIKIGRLLLPTIIVHEELREVYNILLLLFKNSRFWIIFSGHVEAAIKSYKQALLLRPDFPEATCNLLHTLQV